MVTRKYLIAILVLFSLSLFCVQLSPNEAIGAPLVLRLANQEPPGGPRDEQAKLFANLVEEKTKGQVKVEIYSGGTLGDWRQTLEQLEPRSVHIVLEAIDVYELYTPLAGIDSLPYLYKNNEHYDAVWSGKVGEMILKAITEDTGFKFIGAAPFGTRIVTSIRPLFKMEDLQKLRIRVPPMEVYVKTWDKLNAAHTPMAFSEIYTALQLGTIEAQENPISISYTSGFHEVAKYCVMTEHVMTTDVMAMDQNFFDELAPEIQKALLDAGKECSDFRKKIHRDEEKKYYKAWAEKGEIIEWEPEEKERIRVFFKDFVKEVTPHLLPFKEEIDKIGVFF